MSSNTNPRSATSNLPAFADPQAMSFTTECEPPVIRKSLTSANVAPDRTLRGRVRLVLTAIAALALVFVFAPQGHAAVDGYYTVVNRQTGECLDVWGGAQYHAANVGVSRCDGSRNQQWRLDYVGNGHYQVKVRHSGMCLDVAHRGTGDNVDVIQGICADPTNPASYNQQWALQYTDGGYYKLLPRHSVGKCLDKAHWGDVIQYTCHSGWWQQWNFR